tara:strand:+ start:1794 stop:2759 length:966 start_codon:yes stop_codon:yes gene_type:complete
MDKSLRIVFLGTPDFAVASLKAMIEDGWNVVGVITAPDKKAGRGRKVQQSAVKTFAENHELKVLQPTNLKDFGFQSELKALNADLQVVVAFRMLPEAVWNMPSLGTFNLHASLLPNYRGAAPINWAIINGESKTGVTTFFLKHEIDTGDVLFQEEVEISDRETAGSLHDKLMQVGSELVVKSLNAIQIGNYQLKSQREIEQGTIKVAPKIFKEDCLIDWEQNAVEVDQMIRGLSPYPTAWSKIIELESNEQSSLKIFNCLISNDTIELKPGEVKVLDKRILIGTKSKPLEITDLQLAGKKRMLAKELLNGFDLSNYKCEIE